jgi:hypothetical protein
MASPLSPDRALARVLTISRRNGWSVAIFAGLCIPVTLLLGDLVGTFVGLVAVASGAMEIHGHRRLQARKPDGMRSLVRAQLLLLCVILVYSASRISRYDRELALGNVSPAMREALAQLQLVPEDILPLVRTAVWAGYGSVMLVTCLYQGGLALYYRRRTPLIEQALAAPPLVTAVEVAGADPRFYDAVADEIARQATKPGLWARALAESGGDALRTQAVYIRLRVAELQRETNAAAAQDSPPPAEPPL